MSRATSTAAGQELRLGDLTVRQFLRRHWQKQPLLMRNAWHALPYGRTLPASLEPSVEVAQFALTARDLFALARNPDVESRLVFAPDEEALRLGRTSKRAASDTAGWRLRQGPFNRLPSRRQRGWSLLVQGVDLHVPAARALMDRFRFLPDARLDDLMLSFASDGGGVGPHVDSYDVFLLQIQGRRRWAISAPAPATLVPDAPLRILADFRAEQTWVLEPGDMLYLPPGWGHEGTAIGECMTCSIGFRSPSITELRQAFFSYLADRQPPLPNSPPGAAHRYRDRTREALRHPAEIPDDMARTLGDWLHEYRPPGHLVEHFIGCFLTEPKPSVWFAGDGSGGQFAGAAVTLDRKTRMLYRKRIFYINGEAVAAPPGDRAARMLLRALADQRGLDAVQTVAASRNPWLRDTLEEWLASGWLRRAGS